MATKKFFQDGDHQKTGSLKKVKNMGSRFTRVRRYFCRLQGVQYGLVALKSVFSFLGPIVCFIKFFGLHFPKWRPPSRQILESAASAFFKKFEKIKKQIFKNDNRMKFCKKCHKRIIEKIESNVDLSKTQ